MIPLFLFGGSPFPTWPSDKQQPPCDNHLVLINVAPGIYRCAKCENTYKAALLPSK